MSTSDRKGSDEIHFRTDSENESEDYSNKSRGADDRAGPSSSGEQSGASGSGQRHDDASLPGTSGVGGTAADLFDLSDDSMDSARADKKRSRRVRISLVNQKFIYPGSSKETLQATESATSVRSDYGRRSSKSSDQLTSGYDKFTRRGFSVNVPSKKPSQSENFLDEEDASKIFLPIFYQFRRSTSSNDSRDEIFSSEWHRYSSYEKSSDELISNQFSTGGRKFGRKSQIYVDEHLAQQYQVTFDDSKARTVILILCFILWFTILAYYLVKYIVKRDTYIGERP